MKSVFFFLVLFWCGLMQAQTIKYVSAANGNDNWSGGKETPYATVYRALKDYTAGNFEVRVAVGKYKITTEKAGEGELVIPSGVTVRGGYLNGLNNSVQDVQATNPEQPEGQTLFQGDSTCRIARVSGILEQVVIAGGKISGGNGGGVLIEPDGVVRNCIVHSNLAMGRPPKVGDLLMKNGDYLSPSLFTYEQRGQVEGIIYWVNPHKNAPIGEKGKAVSVRAFGDLWVAPVDLYKKTDPPVSKKVVYPVAGASYVAAIPTFVSSDQKGALLDEDGRVNMEIMLQDNPKIWFPLAYRCRQALGNEWYLPAAGEVMGMLTEWNTVDNSFSFLWNEMQRNCSSNWQEMRDYFGLSYNVSCTVSWWNSSEALWHSISGITSATYGGRNDELWVLTSFVNGLSLKTQEYYESTTRKFGCSFLPIYPIRWF